MVQLRKSATSEAGFDPFPNGFVHWGGRALQASDEVHCAGLLFSTQYALAMSLSPAAHRGTGEKRRKDDFGGETAG
jgi:hypothetical protein